MFFKNKVKRVLDVEKLEEKHKDRKDLELEKGDKIAIALAALIVFIPALLIILGVIFLVYIIFPI